MSPQWIRASAPAIDQQSHRRLRPRHLIVCVRKDPDMHDWSYPCRGKLGEVDRAGKMRILAESLRSVAISDAIGWPRRFCHGRVR